MEIIIFLAVIALIIKGFMIADQILAAVISANTLKAISFVSVVGLAISTIF